MPGTTPSLTIVPANEAGWEDLQTVFGTRGDTHKCQCQRYKMQPGESWASVGVDELAFRLRTQTDCGNPKSGTTSGLVAYLDGEPVGWCAVAPRADHPRLLLKTRVPWAGRAEDKSDDGVWAVTCFVTRAGFRRRGISRALARAAVDFARQRGARALEGYPMITQPGQEVTWGELHVGSRSIFAAAGFAEVSRPTLRRVVMRIDFWPAASDVSEHTVERARHPAEVERLDERRGESDLPVVEEAVELFLGRPCSMRGLLLVRAERRQPSVRGENLLHGGDAEAADELVLQVCFTHVETEPFHVGAAEVETEAGAPKSTPKVALFSCVTETGQRDAGCTRTVDAQEAADRLRAPDRHNGNALGNEIPTTA